MKVRSSVKKMCKDCKLIKRHGVLRIICKANPRHKQRQKMQKRARAGKLNIVRTTA